MLALLFCVLLNSDPDITVNPNRPTFASPASTTQVAVAEMELGVQDSFLRDKSALGVVPGLLKYGLVDSFELRAGFNAASLVSQPGTTNSTQGLSLPSFGFQWMFHDGGISSGIQVMHTASTQYNANGTTANLISSSDLPGGVHVDFNLLLSWLEDSGKYDRQFAQAVAVSKTLTDKWSFGGEVYTLGPTPMNPRIYSNLYYVAYKVRPALVLDFGTDIGLNKNAQKYSVFCGLTVGIHRFR